MRKKINTLTITILITCLITHYSPGQVAFQKTFGGADADNGRSVQQTADGGYVIAGYTESFGAGLADVYLIRIDANGDTLWTKTYGGTGNDRAYSLRQTVDGGYIITGKTESFGSGNEDVYLIRTDANGDTLWTKAFGGTGIDRGNSVQQTADGGYIIAGRTSSFGAGGYDVYLIRTDANGDTLWTKTYGGTGDDRSYSVQQTVDAGYIITGRTSNFGAGGQDVYLIRTDSLGDTLWTKTYGGALTDVGRLVQQTADSGYVVAGYTNSFGAGGYDVYLIRTDANGDTLWTKTYGGTGDDRSYSVQQTADVGYIITGETSSFGAGAIDVYLIKTDLNGDTLWTRAFGGTGSDIGYSVQQTADGGYVITGITNSFGAGGGDIYLIKTDANGNSGCNQSATATVVNNTSTLVSSGATIGSGTVVNSTATIVSNAATIDSALCINCNILLSVTINNVSCNGICNGMATVTPSGGTPNYIYVWEDSLGATIPGETDSIIVGLCAGDYAAVITDTNGCIATAPVTITEPAVFASSITATTDVSCNGLCDATATVTPSGGTPPYTFQWLDSTFVPLAPAQTDSTATGLCAGLYILQANDSNNCFVITNTTINQPPALTLSITDTTQASCSGACIGSVTVTPAGGTPPYTYLWDPVVSGQTDSIADSLCAGIYTVTVTDFNGCMIVDNTNIAQPPVLTIALVSTIPASCNGCDGEAVVTGIDGTPPYTYLWDDSLAQTTPTADSLCASTYNATVTDAKGCSATLTVVVSSASGLSSSITNITNTSCFAVCDGAATVSVSGGSFPYTYSWDFLGVPMPAETDSTITGLCAGNYTAIITDNSGCVTTAPVIITQPAVFTSSITSFADIACNGLCDGIATVTAVGGTLPYTYNWLDDLLNPIGQITPTADNLCAGTYNVTIDDANGCFSVSTITITEPPPLTSAITDSSTLVCVCDGFATVTPSGGTTPYTYFWDDPLAQADSTANGLCAGVYNVTVTDANGCVVILSVVITAPNGLVSTIDTSINASCNGVCDGEAVVLASGGIPPFTYAWVDLPADTISGQANSIITGLCPGNYLAMVSDNDGCITATTVTITEPLILTSNITNIVLVSCFDSCDGRAVVTPSGGTAPYTYLWDPQTGGQTDSTAVDLCVGTYDAVVTDDNNCTDTSSVIITGPTILFLLTDATCFGICDGTATADPVGGLAPYIYLWDDPLSQTDSIATGLCEGAYTVIVTDANGCVILDSTAIITPSTQISQTNASCSNICDGTATAQPLGGLAPYNYAWVDLSIPDTIPGETASFIGGLCAGNYTVIVTDANGCATTNSTLIAVDNASPIADAGDNITICEGESILLMASGGISYAWSPTSGLSCTGCQSPEVSPASTTTYTVTVTNLTCSDTDAVIVTVGLCLENIPQVITPNGDGANDIFEITGIESYPENKIMIFNRWGNIVFSADGYHNVNNYWDGTSNSGGRLPDGIYFYVLNLGDGNEPYTGFVMIHR